MNLSTFKKTLESSAVLKFELPNGNMVPDHFHITEIGRIQKDFIDCGGTVRSEFKIGFQMWEANDYDHALAPSKLLNIIRISEEKLGIEDGEIEVEYQMETIGKFGLSYNGEHFLLTQTATDCLAKDKCGIPAEKLKVSLKSLGTIQSSNQCCEPGSSCC